MEADDLEKQSSALNGDEVQGRKNLGTVAEATPKYSSDRPKEFLGISEAIQKAEDEAHQKPIKENKNTRAMTDNKMETQRSEAEEERIKDVEKKENLGLAADKEIVNLNENKGVKSQTSTEEDTAHKNNKGDNLTEVGGSRCVDGLETPLAKKVVERVGGRISTSVGINLDTGGDDAIDSWFLVVLLFGRGINTENNLQTYKLLSGQVGVKTITDAGKLDYQQLWDGLREAKAPRTDQLATRLKKISTLLNEEYKGTVNNLKDIGDSKAMINTLKKFPGIGDTAAGIFLRELRGVWKGANEVPLNDRAVSAAEHLGLLPKSQRKRVRGTFELPADTSKEKVLEDLSRRAGVDVRDVEAGLAKLHNIHKAGYSKCPGGVHCFLLSD